MSEHSESCVYRSIEDSGHARCQCSCHDALPATPPASETHITYRSMSDGKGKRYPERAPWDADKVATFAPEPASETVEAAREALLDTPYGDGWTMADHAAAVERFEAAMRAESEEHLLMAKAIGIVEGRAESDAMVERLRHEMVQASIYLAEGETLAAHNVLRAALADTGDADKP